MTDFALRKVYNFSVYPVELLGDNFKNVTVMAILDEETARQSIDTVGRHKQVFPYLPAGTPNDWRAYNYVKLKLESGDVTVLGLPWIRSDTITEVAAETLVVTISNSSVDRIPDLKAALLANKFPDFDIAVR